MVEKKQQQTKDASLLIKDAAVDMLTINQGMKEQKVHEIQEKAEQAKHADEPLVIHVEPSSAPKGKDKGEKMKVVEQNNKRGASPPRTVTGDSNRIISLEKEIKKLRDINEQKTKDLKEAQENVISKKKLLENQSIQLQQKNSKVKELESRLKGQEKPQEREEAKGKQLDEWKEEIAKRESTIQKLKKELSTLKQQHDTEHQKLKDEGVKIKNLQDNISNLRSQVGSMKKMIDQNKLKISEYENQIKQQKGSSIEKVNQLSNELQKVKSDNEKLSLHETTVIKPLQNKISSLQDQNHQYEGKIKEMEKFLKESEKQFQKIEEKDKSMKKLQQEMNRKTNGFDVQIRNYQSMLREREEHIALLERLLKGLKESQAKEPNVIVIKETEIIAPKQESKAIGSSTQAEKSAKTELTTSNLLSREFWTNLFLQLSWVQYLQSWLSLSGYGNWFKEMFYSWYFTSFLAMLGPLGAFYAMRYRLNNPGRSWGQALYMFVFPLNILLWLDLTLVARRGTNLTGQFLPLINNLPFLTWKSSTQKEKSK